MPEMIPPQPSPKATWDLRIDMRRGVEKYTATRNGVAFLKNKNGKTKYYSDVFKLMEAVRNHDAGGPIA